MLHRLFNRATASVFVACCSFASWTTAVHAEEPQTWVINPSARAFTLIAASVPAEMRVRNVQVTLSVDGETYADAGAGIPREWQLPWSARQANEHVVILVPFGASVTERRFLFPEPGEYYVRWLIATGNPTAPTLRIEQTLKIGAPSAPDVAFLRRVSDPSIFATLFPWLRNQVLDSAREKELSSTEGDVLAVGVIGVLLEATLTRDPATLFRERGGIEHALKWSETLLPLAKEFSESSYAPYAAYFAGCCYSAQCLAQARETIRAQRKEGEPWDDLEERKRRVALVKQNENSAKAFEAFTLAARRADDYLRPRVLYQHGFLRTVTFEFEESQRLLSEAESVAPSEGPVREWIEEARKRIEVLKSQLQGGRTDEVGASRP